MSTQESERRGWGLGRLLGLGGGGRDDGGDGVRPVRENRPVDHSVWVGLDFGTATTKAVVQIEDRRDGSTEFLVVGWKGHRRADAVVVLPSQIRRERDGGFTGAAEILDLEDRSGVTVEMKTRLLDAAPDLAPDGRCDPAGCRTSRDFIDALVHLSMCLATIRRAIREHLGDSAFKMHVQLAAPLEPAGASAAGSVSEASAPVAAVFHELGFRALRGSAAVSGWRIDAAEAEHMIEAAFRDATPAADESPVTLIPEALAAVAAHLDGTDVGSHLFATVDVGGSTTDVAFAWYQAPESHREGEATCWYYSMTTARVGTNDLADAIYGTEAAGRAHAHKDMSRLPSLRNRPGAAACDRVAKRIHEAYTQAWVRALKQYGGQIRTWRKGPDRRTTAWTLLLVGGGNDLDAVSETLEVPPYAESYFDQHRAVERLAVPARLAILSTDGARLEWVGVGAGRRRDPIARASSMLSVAYGLSRRVPDLPRWELDEDGLPPRPEIRERHYEYLMEDVA